MTTLTLAEAAPFFKKKNARAVRQLLRKDPTIPWSGKTGKPIFIQADLEEWLRSGYSEPARKLLKGEPCISEGESGTSASEELDSRLAPPIAKERKRSSTNSTPRRGILSTV